MTGLSLEYEIDAHVGVVTLDRPPVNAVRYQDLVELTAFLSRLPDADELVIVFTTAGETFMAGHDITEFQGYDIERASEHKETYLEFLWSVYECPLVTVAAVDGAAYGAGAILPALCDIVVAAPEAEIAISEITAGVIGGYGPLRRVLPDGVARRMAFTGDPITGSRAYELGMVSDIDSDPVAHARRVGGQIASKNPDAVLAMKQSVIANQPAQPISEYASERDYIIELRQRPNAEEAATAFLENRDPEFDYSDLLR